MVKIIKLIRIIIVYGFIPSFKLLLNNYGFSIHYTIGFVLHLVIFVAKRGKELRLCLLLQETHIEESLLLYVT